MHTVRFLNYYYFFKKAGGEHYGKIGSRLTVLAGHSLRSPSRRGSPGNRGQLCWQLPPGLCSSSIWGASIRVPKGQLGTGQRHVCISSEQPPLPGLGFPRSRTLLTAR